MAFETISAAARLEQLQRRRSAKWTRYPADVLPAWVAEMDFPLAAPIREVLSEALESGDVGYGAADSSGLAEAFSGFVGRRLGWQVDPADVVAAGDVVTRLAELIEILSEEGEGVVLNMPVYHPFFQIVAERRRSLVDVPLMREGGRELDVEGIDRAFAAGARVLILCSPQNPTGVVPGREALTAVAESAVRHGAWVLADEIHAALTLPGAEHTSFLSLGEAARERGIALTSATKAFNVAGLGCAQVVTASESAARQVAKLPSGALHPSHFGLLAATAAYSSASAEGWLDQVLSTLDSNRALLGELLAERLPEVGYEPPQAGYLAWLDLRELGLGADPSVALLERGRVALSPGPQFGTQGEGFVRLNIGTYPELVREAVERIAGAVGR